MSVLVLNGPNLNLLGSWEPGIYGSTSLAQIEQWVRDKFAAAGVDCEFFQSNAEHEIVEQIQAAAGHSVSHIIINPAAFTHTSVAIRDALAAVAIPFIEIHLSNPHAREAFRRHSYLSDIARGVIAGFGADSYLLASEMVIKWLGEAKV